MTFAQAATILLRHCPFGGLSGSAMAHHGDNSFGPQYGDQFDFTLRFELIILTILPASVLLTMYPILLYHYTHKPVVVSRSWSLYVKLVSKLQHLCSLYICV